MCITSTREYFNNIVLSGYLLFSIAVAIQSSEAISQSLLRFEHLGSERGLSQVSIIHIFQDSKGYMWFSTEDGLNHFDGYDFKVYRHDPADPSSISSSITYSLLEDQKGYIWIVTMNSLERFDYKTGEFTHFFPNNSDKSALADLPMSLYIDSQNRLWVGTLNGLHLYDYPTGTFTRYQHNPGDESSVVNNFVGKVIESENGDVWVQTSSGASKFDEQRKQFTRVNIEQQAIDKSKYDKYSFFSIDRNKTIFHSAQDGGVYVFDPENEQSRYYNYAELGINGRVSSIVRSKNNDMWIGSNKGLYHYSHKRKRLKHYTSKIYDPYGLFSDQVITLLEDKNGVLWVGTKDAGIHKLSPTSLNIENILSAPDNFDSPSGNVISAIAVVENDGLWIGNYGGRLLYHELDSGQVTHYELNWKDEVAPPDFRISSIETNSDAGVWIGSAGRGLMYININSGRQELYKYDAENPNSIADNYVHILYRDRDQQLWVGNKNGVSRVDKNTRSKFYNYIFETEQANESFENMVTSIFEDNDDRLWALTFNGYLWRYNQKTDRFEKRQYRVGFKPHNTLTALSDSQGRIWVGTFSGLVKYIPDSGSLKIYDERNGLQNHAINSIIEDEHGRLWVATNNGLHSFNTETEEFDVYDRSYGIYNDEYSANASVIAADGKIYLGGLKGVTGFYPNEMPLYKANPDVALTDIKIFDQSIEKRRSEKFLNSGVYTENLVEIDHTQKVLSFSFTANDYAIPEMLQFAYMLEGFDQEWIVTDHRAREARYTNLDAGDYIFKVRAKTPASEWSEVFTDINVRVLPAPWKTVWAYIIYAILIVIIIFLLIWFRTLALHRHARELAVEVEERTSTIQKLLQQKVELFAGVSHEFRTPLTIILGHLSKLTHDFQGETPTSMHDNGQALDNRLKRLEIINRNAKRLLRLVDQLLNLTRLQKPEGLERNRQLVPFDSIVGSLVSSFQAVAEQKNINLNAICEIPGEVWVNCEADMPEKLISNLVSNAIKYTPPGGTVTISLEEKENGFVLLKVSDSGIGIDAKDYERIFEPFVRLQDENSAHIYEHGTGIGLTLIKELVHAHDGSVEVSSEPNVGTVFSVYLPFFKNRLQDQENNSGEGRPDSQVAINGLIGDVAEGLSEDISIGQNNQIGENGGVKLLVSDKPILLIIEDYKDMRDYLSDIFQEHFNCIFANDGESGISIAFDHTPDLILCDLMLPGITGYNVIDELKLDQRTSHIPIILLTARCDKESRMEGLRQHADDYLTKPFDSEELLLRLNNLLSTQMALKERVAAHIKNNMSASKSVLEEENIKFNEKDHKFLKRFHELLDAHYMEKDLDLTTIASHMCMTTKQVQRKLKALLDHNPIEYLRSYRIKKSLVCLETGISIAEVADKVGFSNSSYFGVHFKHTFGVSPKQFQIEQMNKKRQEKSVS